MVNLKNPIVTPKQKHSLSLVYRNSDQTVPEKLMQPLNVAIVVSLVIHGVAGYGLPSLPFFQRPSIPKEVRIVELTPQEQSRIRRDAPPLPPSVSGVPLPGVPNPQGTAVNPGLYNFGTGTSSNNLGGGRTNFSAIPGFPTFNPDSQEDFNLNQGRQWSVGRFGSNGQFVVPEEDNSPPRNTQPQTGIPRDTPQAPPPLRQFERFTNADNFTTGGQALFSRSLPLATPSPSPSNTPSPSPSVAVTPSPSPSVAVTSSPSPSPSSGGDTGVAVNPTPTSSPSPSPGNNGEAGNPGGNNSDNSDNNGNGGTPSPNGVIPSPNGVTPNPLLAFDPRQTELTADGLSIGFTDFLGEGNEALLQKDRQMQLTLEVPYPSAACGPQLGGTAILGVILNEEGKISKGPAILQSSGYEIFNQAAIEAAKVYTQFTPAKVYIITVPFAYKPEACSGGSNE
ncbi:MAG: TonB family protein [Coleofasciculaceae cyanobacterium SM2_1_6]|nr:TonB family protein [Coleofasciculaceae cyanobacterium SM2_1_6]